MRKNQSKDASWTGRIPQASPALLPEHRKFGAQGRSAEPILRALGILGALSLGVAAAALALSFMGGMPVHSPVPFREGSLEQEFQETRAGDPEVERAAPHPWTALVLHHSATQEGSARSFDNYHRTHNGWPSLGYHFVVGNGSQTPDGALETGPRWTRQEPGAHANSSEFNTHGIGICLVGNFELEPPTEAQVQTVSALVGDLCRRFKIPRSRVFSHGQIREGGSTACPGRLFPLEKIKAAVE